ncbi:GNAT family N-acetyltransferase [Roseomonas xinghualingensis]|uniref:GNAT family N-acetyltransferase n=1 Tax=Roseomonas xinghualingensis TaxID=2986475 RepID=UPI0021F0C637|nr:GNAT family N-acetyltransferase [Roseomonas sp. SXEYE001]MCV4208534.1 GNAT family N-acetyltransferase [Roseomonas sp. SXEYE001]
MAPTDTLSITALTPAAMKGCLVLSDEAGWNQGAEDWDVFFQHGTVFGIEDADQLLATGAALPYPGGFGWVSMVLVSATQRGQGLGTRILRRCIEALGSDGLCPVLDATPAGERIYRPLGFRTQLGLTRWRGMGGEAASAGARPLVPEDLPAIAASDAATFGADRGTLLHDLFRRAPAQAFRSTDGTGFVLARPGRRALQIGPLVADSEAEATCLLDAALGAAQGPVLLDLADRWAGLAEHLRTRGLTPERPFNRMALNRAEPFGDPARLMVAAGPELG